MRTLHSGNRESLHLGPNLWAGIGLVRGGAGTALVGSPEEVVERIQEYAELGIDTFIFSGYPHLEEAYRTAELLFPRLTLNSVSNVPLVEDESTRGESIANHGYPYIPFATR